MYIHIYVCVCVIFFSFERMSLFITVCVLSKKKTKENISAAYEQIRFLLEYGKNTSLLLFSSWHLLSFDTK